MLNRELLAEGKPRVNPKRIYRIMREAQLLRGALYRKADAHARRPGDHAAQRPALVLGQLRDPLPERRARAGGFSASTAATAR
jgi:hypothetical protein